MAYNISQKAQIVLCFPEEVLAAPQHFLSNQLPANNYGIGGGISLYDNPIIPLSDEDAEKLVRDIHNIRDRIDDTGHLFYRELIGGLALPLIYDLFYFHARNRTPIFATDRSMYVVKELMALLESGRIYVAPTYTQKPRAEHTYPLYFYKSKLQ